VSLWLIHSSKAWSTWNFVAILCTWGEGHCSHCSLATRLIQWRGERADGLGHLRQREPTSEITKITFYCNVVARFSSCCKATYTYCMDGNLPEGGMQIYVKWPARKMMHCHRYLEALLTPYLSGIEPFGDDYLASAIWCWAILAATNELFWRWANLALALICLITVTQTSFSLELSVSHLAWMFLKRVTFFQRRKQTLCVGLEMRFERIYLL